MNRYWFAGETIESELDLGLAQSAAPADATVRVVHHDAHSRPQFVSYVMRGMMGGNDWALGRTVSDDGWRFSVPPYGHGTIRDDGSEIELFSSLDDRRALAELTTTWILVYRLAVMDRWSFHGSAVQLGNAGSGVAVFGASGAGKSSSAAALVAAGCLLLADDTIAGHVHDRTIEVCTTTAQLRLRSKARQLAPKLDTLDQSESADGRLIVTTQPGASTSVERLVFLRSDGPTTLEPLSQAAVVAELLRNSKVVAWVDPTYRSREFEVACDIAHRVSGFALRRADHCDSVGEFAQFARVILSGLDR